MTATTEIAPSGPPFEFSSGNLDEARRIIAKYPTGDRLARCCRCCI